MGIRVCQSDEGAWLYESVSMRPINTESFHDEEEAADFIRFCAHAGVEIALADAETLDRMQDAMRELHVCKDCDERILVPGESRPTEQCSKCEESERYDDGIADGLVKADAEATAMLPELAANGNARTSARRGR